MKIGILTHYTVNNQGAQLQLYALYNFLKDLGHDVYVQTYRKNYDFDSNNNEKRNEISAKSIGYILKEFVLKKGIRLTLHNIKKYKINNKFRTDNFNFCHYAIDHVDVSVVGSDEVFSIDYGPNIMMFGHGVNADHLIAYAPCIGRTTMEEIEAKHCRALMESGLKQFEALSARDEHTIKMVSFLTGEKNIPLVCDPVLLYDFSKVNASHRKIKDKYLIAYTYDRYFTEPEQIQAIRNYAASKGLKVASVGTFHKWCDYNIACDPLSWIEYFRDAEEVVTNTFHGTILSIITNTPMAVMSKQPKIISLLENLGLQERRMQDLTEIESIMSKPLDFEEMNKKWMSMRKFSESFIKDALGNIRNN